ncbi:conjugal transfer protein TraF [Parasutterella secunda]|uniref:Conjugal transfer protein TraF n=1 Tax=Parasutterella secunda TaxID=626947 RepID=A0ABS2GT29_9BURK|nr:conjugal transfer protein TraF [Parasutterella secunda]MBM6929008.1 conjugal transfer protein TraF [Parasutterella secunda]
MKKTLVSLLLLTPLLANGANEDFWTQDVWSSPDRGFLFYQEKTQDNPKELEEFKTVEELRAEAQRRLNIAVMDPTEENLKGYLAINTLMLEKSTVFAQRWKETLWANPGFDHTVIHPNANFAQVALKDEKKLAKEASLKSLASQAGLVVLVQAECSFCSMMAPVMTNLSAQTGISVLPVSIKGDVSNDWPNAKPDNGIVKRLMTLSSSVPTVTPAVFLVDRTGQNAQLIASGALSLEDLKDRLVQASGLSQPMNSTIKTLPRL